ncbi:hypothetical protein F1D05_27895 [Kribbella qitaiheensis]|uniref:Glycosyl hydrolase family 98 putative carbohydrate-binding module domain-containing protein n=1 Tax=Kribbella qitaiheensis TaxID=1544730 RepID=A0A7G6X468_9ACTN|nr:NPCBM/NEW2 domain-containing protein [Kribbella qitaiheensis]QNE21033.1 hypothetical protein F1D05_27895 [Kribbella qitaiheensis]
MRRAACPSAHLPLPVVQVLALMLTCGVAGVLTAALPGRAAAVDGPSDVYTYLENPGMVAEGQVAPHTRLWPYADDAAAVRASGSQYVRSLDGAWKFKLADTPGKVPTGCTRFEATVGLDAEVGGSGSVTFEVKGADGAVLASTPRMTGGGSGVNLSAALSGQSQVQLAVTDAGDGNGTDHADWAAARFTCG